MEVLGQGQYNPMPDYLGGGGLTCAAGQTASVPTATSDGLDLYYETEGDGETVAFVGDVGYGAWQWSFQAPALTGPFETLVWDLRGTGRSEAPAGPYDVAMLAGDLEAVLGAADVRRCHLVGAGLGGAIALRYAREYDRARSLTLLGSTDSGAAVDLETLRACHPTARDADALRDSLAPALSAEFRAARSELVEQMLDWRDEDANTAARDAQIAAFRAFEAEPLHELALPALVMHGEADPIVPVERGKRLADGLPRGEFVPVAGRHLAWIEQAGAVSDELLAWLEACEGP